MQTEVETSLSTPAEVVRLLRWSQVIFLDLETTGLNPRTDRVRLLTVGDGRQVLTMDCFAHDPRSVIDWLRGKILVCHHAGFDLGFLWHLGLTDLPETICTYLMAQVITAGHGAGVSAHGFPPLGLGACCEHWLQKPLSKELQTSNWNGELSAEQLAYARKDVEVLPALLRAMDADLDTGKLQRAADVEHQALRTFVWMSQTGVLFDRDLWRTLANKAAVEVSELEIELNRIAPKQGSADLFGEHLSWDWSSPKQVGEVLEALGVPISSTDDSHLAECKHPIGELLRKHRSASKRVSTYGHDWLSHVAQDGRVYPQWRQLGAAAGRTSCAHPNMQQLPRQGEYRRCVVPPKGCVLVKADYSQIELRLACVIAKEKRMLEAYRTGQDLHVLTAARLTGKPLEQVTEADRQIAKSANFGLLYGMGARGYAAYAKTTYGVDLSEEQATKYRAAFFEEYPGLAAWHARTRNANTRETRTLTGRRRQLPVGAPDTWRLNTPVQGTGADGLKLALGLLWERRERCPSARPILAVHDEIVVEVPEAHAEAAKSWVTEAMIDAMAPLLHPVPVAVDAKIQRTWGK